MWLDSVEDGLKAGTSVGAAGARILLELPIGAAQARAHGIPHDSAHLVLSELDVEANAQCFSNVFAEFVTRAKTIAIMVVNPFPPKEQQPAFLGARPSGLLLGYDTYLVHDRDVWREIARVRAEWVAFVGVDAALLSELSSRLERKESPWWKLSIKSEFGALASEIDLADPLGVYFPSDDTVELFGSYDEILIWFRSIISQPRSEPGMTRTN